MIQRRSSDNHYAKIPSRDKEKWQRDDQKNGERSSGTVSQHNIVRSASKPWLQEAEPFRSRRPVPDKCFDTSKRSPRDPRIRHRVEPVAAPRDSAKAPAYDHCEHYDPFERRVFKLKLQEADADEKLSCEPLSVAEIALYERRRNKIGVERARLEAQNLERFEKVYATTRVSNVALKRYQDNRDFAWRVICFKERQASLQQQKYLLVSEEVKREKWRQLDEDRESLMAENSYMFHTVMMENDGEFQHRENADTNMSRRSGKRASGGEIQRGQPKFKRRAAEVIQPNFADSTTSSRVVIGAALQLKGNGIPSSTFDRSRPKNTPWFLKG
ncbi:hypothetical protein PI124_g15996 [Phytophthora idaei]|nr:hypothetical protein PI124_g15996 [Phytophthora idaei]